MAKQAAVIGGGPAGLAAAEVLAQGGVQVTVYDRMPTLGRKLLMAGRGGLNLTHSEDLDAFVGRYGGAAARLRPMLEAFPPEDLRAWAEALGQPTFVGTSGRVFPTAMKASPLLRAWLGRLEGLGVRFALRRAWRGWTEDGGLVFDGPEAAEHARPDATVLALGGASWPRLGSDGRWVQVLEARGVAVSPLRPANCGFVAAWTPAFAARFAGRPLSGAAFSFGGRTVRGEAMLTMAGIEGQAIYALAADLREAIAAEDRAALHVDLRPQLSAGEITGRLSRGRAGESRANLLRRALKLSPQAANLLREAGPLPPEPRALAERIKAAPVVLTATAGLERAISTAGGVGWEALDAGLMLAAFPGVYACGEMLDWEAPTGGYLLQACFATGRHAGGSALARLAAG